MKNIIALLLAISLTNFAFAPQKSTLTRALISFQVKNMGINTSGAIGGIQAEVKFNPADLSTSTLEASAEVNTLNTDNSARDEHLKSEDYFDAAHYPKIFLSSVSFKHKSGKNYSGMFKLTIKDKIKLIEIPFTYSDSGNSIALSGSFKINRIDFGIGSSSLILANEVTVHVEAEVTR